MSAPETTDYLGLAAWLCRPTGHTFARRDLPRPDEEDVDDVALPVVPLDVVDACTTCGGRRYHDLTCVPPIDEQEPEQEQEPEPRRCHACHRLTTGLERCTECGAHAS